MKKFQEGKERKIHDQILEKEKEIQKLKKELQSINKKSRHASPEVKVKMHAIQQDTKNRLIIENLYEPKINEIREKLNDGATFKPEINEKSKRIVRDTDICNILYQDAKNREERHKERVNSEISNTRKRANSKNKRTERNNK